MYEVAWGFLIALALYFGGISGGSFCFAVIASRRTGEAWRACAYGAAVLSPIALFLAVFMLVLDLGRKLYFWITITTINPVSPMSIGVWMLVLFGLVSLFFALCQIPRLPRIGWIRKLRSLLESHFTKYLEVIGLFLAVGVCIYTGVLLSVTSVPLWRNLFLPFLFLLSGLTTGFADGILSAQILSKRQTSEFLIEPVEFMRQKYRLILILYLLTLLLFCFWPLFTKDSARAGYALIGGWSGLIWWIGVVGIGIVVPIVYVFRKKVFSSQIFSRISVCVTIGGLLMRILILFVGQGAL